MVDSVLRIESLMFSTFEPFAGMDGFFSKLLIETQKNMQKLINFFHKQGYIYFRLNVFEINLQ
jgi:hypothetical protein